jgi:hypothetical protein
MFCSPFAFSAFVTRNFLLLGARRNADVHFGLLLLGFSGPRWIYYRGLTILLLGGRFVRP